MTDSMDLGGGGGHAFSFGAMGSQPGTFVVGKVLALAEVQARVFEGTLKGQPATWDNGDPKMQYRITLQTDLREDRDDDGKRDVYIDGRRTAYDNGGKSKLCAVLDAVRAVTGGTALAVGGHLRLHWVSGLGIAGDPRNYEALYQAPSVELGGQPAAAQQVAPGTPADPFPAHSAPATQAPPAGWAPTLPANVAYAGPPPPTFAASPQAVENPVQNPHNGHAVMQQHAPEMQAVQTEQGPVNPQTGEIAGLAVPGGPIITAEAVAAVKAGGMDPAQVWPGVDLTPFGA